MFASGDRAKLAAAAVALLACSFAVAKGADAQPNDDCISCHGDKELVREMPDGRKISMYIDIAALGGSIHAPLACVDCHQDLAGTSDFPHAEELAEVACGECHEDVQPVHEKSAHGISPSGEGARCLDCHGTHFILPKTDPRSSVYHLAQPNTCGRCHEDPGFLRRHPELRQNVQAYTDSIHGKGVLKYGLNIAATCADCHGEHDVRRHGDPTAATARAHIGDVCGKCHPSALASYKSGIHGVVSAEGKSEPAVCTDCHGEHEIRAPTDARSSVYVTKIVETCAKCHSNKEIVGKFGVSTERVDTYQESFHGIGTKYGSTVVANCVSCHEYHDIKPAGDPSSSTHPDNLAETCGQPRCHLGATARFSRSNVHASITKADSWILQLIRGIYVLLIGGTIGGMIVHNLLDYAGRRRLRGRREPRHG